MTWEYINTVIAILRDKIGMESYENELNSRILNLTKKSTSHAESLRKIERDTFELYENETLLGSYSCDAYVINSNKSIMLDTETAELFKIYHKKDSTINIISEVISEPNKDEVKKSFPELIPILDEADMKVRLQHEKQRDDVLDFKRDMERFLKKYGMCI